MGTQACQVCQGAVNQYLCCGCVTAEKALEATNVAKKTGSSSSGSSDSSDDSDDSENGTLFVDTVVIDSISCFFFFASNISIVCIEISILGPLFILSSQLACFSYHVFTSFSPPLALSLCPSIRAGPQAAEEEDDVKQGHQEAAPPLSQWWCWPGTSPAPASDTASSGPVQTTICPPSPCPCLCPVS